MTKPSATHARTAVGLLVLAASTLVGIAVHEGYREEAYIPVPGDVPTIDFGRTKGVKLGDRSNPVRGLQYLLDDLEDVYAAGVKRCVKVPLYQHEYESFVRLAYSVGVPTFCHKADKRTVDAKGRPRKPDPDQLIDLINAQRYDEACARIEAFVYGPDGKGGKKVLKGLQNRRAEERRICEGRAL